MVDQGDVHESSSHYLDNVRDFLAKGEQALAEGDLLQASEKFWGASAQIVKALAERRGWEHSSHRALFQVINRLASDTDDDELRSLFLEAGQLHTNFYEGWLPAEMVQRGGGRVRELVERLRTML